MKKNRTSLFYCQVGDVLDFSNSNNFNIIRAEIKENI